LQCRPDTRTTTPQPSAASSILVSRVFALPEFARSEGRATEHACQVRPRPEEGRGQGQEKGRGQGHLVGRHSGLTAVSGSRLGLLPIRCRSPCLASRRVYSNCRKPGDSDRCWASRSALSGGISPGPAVGADAGRCDSPGSAGPTCARASPSDRPSERLRSVGARRRPPGSHDIAEPSRAKPSEVVVERRRGSSRLR
jgi:hypothetical protein